MRILFPLVLLLALQSVCLAEEFVSVPISELKYPAGAPPSANSEPRWNGRGWEARDIALYPSVQIDGPGEAYLLCVVDANWFSQPTLDCPNGVLAFRLPAVEAVTGWLVTRDGSTGKAVRTKFSIAKEALRSAWKQGNGSVAPAPTGANRHPGSPTSARAAFFAGKENRYNALFRSNATGAAWFRHQAASARKERGGKEIAETPLNRQGERLSTLEDTFDLFSGGRAVSENLQLDRGLLLSESGEEKIDVATVAGITVAEIDWAPLNKDAKPDADLLARSIPADQYAIFFPSIPAMIALMDEAQRTGGELLSIMELRAEDAGVRDRYQQQLCLPLSEFTRIVGPALVNTVALTGSDPYFRTGTDVALLLESPQKEAVVAYISARYAAVKATEADAQVVNGSTEGVSFSGLVTPDRRISSYLAVLDNTVIVSNSRVQLERVIAATKGKAPQLAGLGEYTFFRSRYRKGPNDSGLLIVPDAAIRKWGGPVWRIGDSRRSRAASMLSELQANELQKIVRGELRADGIDRTRVKSVAALGDLSVDAHGLRSSKYGTLGFLTPISELSIAKISAEEQSAYVRFRDSYSAYWRGYFDPIGLQFSLQPGERGMDLTVMPLIVGTDYRELMQIAQRVTLDEFSGDLHPEALITFTAAVDSTAQWAQAANRQSQMFLPGLQNPLSWIGKSFTLFLDQSPLFEQARTAPNKEQFLQSHYQEIPVGLFIEVQDSLKLTAVLTAVRSFVEQSTPGMTVWENLTHEGVPYVKISEAISAVAAARETGRKPWGLYYVATPEALVLSLREDVLTRAIGRLKERTSERAKAQRAFAVGSQAALVATKDLLQVVERIGGEDYGKVVRARCWSNLPILNEWKTLFPDRDPVALHQQLWKTRPHCPAGGEYVWNEEARTMESTVLGHPGAPRELPRVIPTLKGVEGAALALGFENNGLRAKAVLRGTTEKKAE